MNNLILTICVGNTYKEIGDLTHPSIKAYAEKIGADFIAISESSCSTPHWQKMIEIKKALEKYDRVLYVDTDIIIRDDCPDLFEFVSEDKLAMFNEGKFTERSKELLIDTCKAYNIFLPDWDNRYFNTGVMLIPRKYGFIFEKPNKEYSCYYEQTYLNMMFALHKPEIQELHYEFNRMCCMDKLTGEERHQSWIIHYAGFPDPNKIKELIKRDLEKWEKDKLDGYNYKRHILIKAGGGLGDQICAEPAIRFMVKTLYSFEDVTVATHWKEIFDHIKGITLVSYDDFKYKDDTPYFEVMTLPEPDSLQWFIVSHLLCHSVDYTSMALMKRILPLVDKTPKLIYSENDLLSVKEKVGGFDNLVLVHAGRHWKTKTFPTSWWNEIIKGLKEKGKRVCLIGREDIERGTQDVDTADIIDLRNKTNIKELFALIANSPLLISNDSSPVHVAGAFDNEIILIPSCKHPDHILHWRKGNQYYKAKALYKKLLIDEVISHPTQVYETSADFEVQNWSDYLPTPKEILENIK